MPKAIGNVPCYISPVLTAVRVSDQLRYYCVLTCIALVFFFFFCCDRIIILLGNAAAIKAPMTGGLCREKYEIELCD